MMYAFVRSINTVESVRTPGLVSVCGVMYWISPHTLSLKWTRQIAVCECSVCVYRERENIYKDVKIRKRVNRKQE